MSTILFVCLLIIFLLLIKKYFIYFYRMQFIKLSAINVGKYNLWNIPGPMVIPFFGTKWIYLWKYKISKLHNVFFDFNKNYGPIVLEVSPSGHPIVHLFDKLDIEKVLRYPSKYPYRPPTEIVMYYRKSRPDRYASIGITNEQGEKWHQLRTKLTHHITSLRIINNFIPEFNLVFDDFIRMLKQHRNPVTNSINNFHEIANLMGLESICTFILGRRMGFLSDESKQPKHIKDLAEAVKVLFISQRDSYFGWGLWKYLPSKTYRDFERSEEIIYGVISDLVDKSYEEEQLNCDTEDIRSVFINILQAEDLDIKDKKSAIIDFIAAGIETTANTLIFMLYHICKNKRAINKILEEFANENVSVIGEKDIKNAMYTKACLMEVYRIQPTAFCLARVLEEDMILSNYHLKSGTVVLCQNMIACNNDRYFKNATEFNPDRWIYNNNYDQKDDDVKNNSSLVCPFGIGKRTCPGKRFVEMEMILLIAKLILAFDINFTAPLETEFEFLLAPKVPIQITLNDRHD